MVIEDVEGLNVYISGPVTGHRREDVKRAFDTVERALRDGGADVFNPVAVIKEDARHEYAMLRCLNELTMTDWSEPANGKAPYIDLMVQLPGWETSSGCDVECKVAKALGIEVFPIVEIEED